MYNCTYNMYNVRPAKCNATLEFNDKTETNNNYNILKYNMTTDNINDTVYVKRIL